MTSKYISFTNENRGKVLLLFLLFFLALYEFKSAGFTNYAIICLSPIAVIFIYAVFKWRMTAFWMLIVINYLIPFKNISWHMPVSLLDEAIELILIGVAIIDVRKSPHFGRALNTMLLAIIIWSGLCFIELFNDTCGLGINVTAWFMGVRIMALQLLWIILVFSLYVDSPKVLMTYLKLWAFLSLFSAFWTWKMKTIGMTPSEISFLYGAGQRTHLLNAGTLIRYWSTFTDAANYGCNAAGAAVCFLIIGIMTKIRKDKIFFLLIFVAVTWGMFQSGTRTAIFCMIGGFSIFLVLSRSIKLMIPSAIIGVFFLFILMFTNIGSGNQQIRRMRSAFNKDDASANVREVNKAAIAKYMKEAPWGIGIGMYSDNIPANNKFRLLSEIPPDSEYVFIWVRTGPIGVSIFAFCMVFMLAGACYVVMFRLKNRSLIGIGAGFCAAFTAIQLGGYANQVIFQYPNGLIFYGGLAMVYLLPYMEPEWIKHEEKKYAEQEEKKKLKLEKRLAKRV